jgi:hypothetical protein
MPIRGEITVECDSETCQAEQLFGPDDFEGSTLEARLDEKAWRVVGNGKRQMFVCPQCIEEGK